MDGKHSKTKGKSIRRERVDSLPHSILGGAMHYFPAWTMEFVLNMSWKNFTLFMASIPIYEEEKPEEKIITKDASEIF